MPFQASFNFCFKTFKTGAALNNHPIRDHPSLLQQKVDFKDSVGNVFEQPKSADITSLRLYLRWLTILVERVSNYLIPCHPGKWIAIDCFQVPSEYFSHILHRLSNPALNSVRAIGHRRPPMFRKQCVKLSYKIYEESQLLILLE
ncbi:hypothetical protein QZH41_010199 [Actinostola sp. cb2023]|nr:hypothetical protein QZH41_010199 [Actinostola sp. cb2023]